MYRNIQTQTETLSFSVTLVWTSISECCWGELLI